MRKTQQPEILSSTVIAATGKTEGYVEQHEHFNGAQKNPLKTLCSCVFMFSVVDECKKDPLRLPSKSSFGRLMSNLSGRGLPQSKRNR